MPLSWFNRQYKGWTENPRGTISSTISQHQGPVPKVDIHCLYYANRIMLCRPQVFLTVVPWTEMSNYFFIVHCAVHNVVANDHAKWKRPDTKRKYKSSSKKINSTCTGCNWCMAWHLNTTVSLVLSKKSLKSSICVDIFIFHGYFVWVVFRIQLSNFCSITLG